MKIELHEIPVNEVVEGYKDNEEKGVVGYGGHLNIRPPYQREFIYGDKQREEVIRTVMRDFPLNVMYWIKNGDSEYEILDGQQRTISICQYVAGDFSVDHKGITNITETEKNQILNYKLMIYICEGNDKEKLDWFKIINIAGERLTAQELRNAVYTGEWLSDAKKYFSKTGCPAYSIASNYLMGTPIRQDYLETAISWIAKKGGKEIEDYMAEHQHNPNSNELWTYFQAVINWISLTFTNYRKEMKGIDWGSLYDTYHGTMYDTKDLETKIATLMADPDVTNKKGIYDYVLSGNESKLNVRAFDERMKREAYERQKGICPKCGKHFELNEMQADHITPWAKGGKTIAENCNMLCADCNRKKSDV